MTHIYIDLAESIACGGIFMLLYSSLISKKASFLFCRRYLIFAMIASCTIPIVEIPVYFDKYDSQIEYDFSLANYDNLIAQDAINPEIIPEQTQSINGKDIQNIEYKTSVNLTSVISGIYISGIIISLSLLIASLIKIRKLKNRSDIVKYGPCYLAKNAEINSPFSFMHTVFLGNDYDVKEHIHLLNHEFSHIRHGHSQEKILMIVIRSILWFNPFSWIAEKKLEEVQEWQADQDAIASGTNVEEYQDTIIKMIFGINPSTALGLNNSFTKNRVLHMRMKEVKNHGRLVNIVTICLTIVCICFFSCKPSTRVNAADNFSNMKFKKQLDSSSREQLQFLYYLEDGNRLFIYADKKPDACVSDNDSFFHYSIQEDIIIHYQLMYGGIEIYENRKSSNEHKCIIAINGYRFAESTKSRKLYWVTENTWIYINDRKASLDEFHSIDDSTCIGVAYYRSKQKGGPSLVYVITSEGDAYHDLTIYNYKASINYPGADLPEFESVTGIHMKEERMIVQSHTQNIAEPDARFAINGHLTDFKDFSSNLSSIYVLRNNAAEQRYGAGVRAVIENRTSGYNIFLRFEEKEGRKIVPFVNGKEVPLETLQEHIVKCKRKCEEIGIDTYMDIIFDSFVPQAMIDEVMFKYIPKDDPNFLVTIHFYH